MGTAKRWERRTLGYVVSNLMERGVPGGYSGNGSMSTTYMGDIDWSQYDVGFRTQGFRAEALLEVVTGYDIYIYIYLFRF